MGDTSEHDAAARDNGARLAAWLLWRHGLTIDKLVTHTYWVSAGKTFADADTQCTNPISGKKWCSTYIFGSSVDSTAKKNWIAFKELVQSYLTALAGGGAAPAQPKQEDNDMNQEKFNQMFNTAMQQYRQSLRDNDSGTWGQETRNFVIELIGAFSSAAGPPRTAPPTWRCPSPTGQRSPFPLPWSTRPSARGQRRCSSRSAACGRGRRLRLRTATALFALFLLGV